MSLVRPAKLADVPRICRAGKTFFEESNLRDLTFDTDLAEITLCEIIESPSHMILVSEDSAGLLQGFISFDVQRTYTKEFMAHTFLFFVNPASRNKNVGKELLKAALSSAQAMGARVFYAASTGGFDDPKNNQLFLHLFEKMGAEQLGCFVRLQMNDPLNPNETEKEF